MCFTHPPTRYVFLRIYYNMSLLTYFLLPTGHWGALPPPPPSSKYTRKRVRLLFPSTITLFSARRFRGRLLSATTTTTLENDHTRFQGWSHFVATITTLLSRKRATRLTFSRAVAICHHYHHHHHPRKRPRMVVFESSRSLPPLSPPSSLENGQRARLFEGSCYLPPPPPSKTTAYVRFRGWSLFAAAITTLLSRKRATRLAFSRAVAICHHYHHHHPQKRPYAVVFEGGRSLPPLSPPSSLENEQCARRFRGRLLSVTTTTLENDNARSRVITLCCHYHHPPLSKMSNMLVFV